MARIRWEPKDPDEVLDYIHDWTARLDGDTIASTPTASVTSGDVVISSTSTTGGLQTVWLTGGTNNTTSHIRLRCTTTGGRTFDEGIEINIVTKG